MHYKLTKLIGLKPNDEKNAEIRKLTWKSMENLYENGLTKSIGVSNYTLRHLTDLINNYSRIKPHLLQVSPFDFEF